MVIDGQNATLPRNPASPYAVSGGRVLRNGLDLGLSVEPVHRPRFYDLVTADAEQRITDAAGGPKGLGANAEDRARVLRLALHDDEAYREALEALRAAQAEVERLAATVENAIDERKAADRASRDQLTAVLQQLGGADDEHPADVLTLRLTPDRRAA